MELSCRKTDEEKRDFLKLIMDSEKKCERRKFMKAMEDVEDEITNFINFNNKLQRFIIYPEELKDLISKINTIKNATTN